MKVALITRKVTGGAIIVLAELNDDEYKEIAVIHTDRIDLNLGHGYINIDEIVDKDLWNLDAELK